MKQQVRDRLFYFLCLTMPFLFVPKVLHLNFIGGPIGTMLMIYSILLAFIYTLYCYKKDNKIFINKGIFVKFIILYIIILIVSLIHGLIIYPYYDLIFNGPPNQIEKLSKLINLLSIYNIKFDEKILLGAWMIARVFKSLFFEIIYTFGFSYIIYCWYKNDPQKALKIIRNSIYFISIIIILYSFIELFFLFGYDWAKNFLINFNPYLHEIKANFEWWPPLLWNGRMRSIFPEPSQFGMYTAFMIPFLWANILNKNHKMLNLVLVCIITLFVFLTQAKTAVLLLFGEMFLLTIYVLYKRKYLVKSYMQILVVVVCAFGLSIWCINNYNTKPFAFLTTNTVNIIVNQKEAKPKNNQQTVKQNKQANNSNIEKNTPQINMQNKTQNNNILIKKYVENNISGVVIPNSGSNNARFAIMKSDLRIWQDNILLGVGNGLKSVYTTKYLTEKELQNRELANCKNLQDKEGVLKTGYPGVNEFSSRLAQNGIIGFILYIFPFFFLVHKFHHNRNNYKFDFKENNNVICMLIALVASFVTGMSGMLTTIQTYWLLLGIAYAYMMLLKNKKEEGVE